VIEKAGKSRRDDIFRKIMPPLWGFCFIIPVFYNNFIPLGLKKPFSKISPSLFLGKNA